MELKKLFNDIFELEAIWIKGKRFTRGDEYEGIIIDKCQGTLDNNFLQFAGYNKETFEYETREVGGING